MAVPKLISNISYGYALTMVPRGEDCRAALAGFAGFGKNLPGSARPSGSPKRKKGAPKRPL